MIVFMDPHANAWWSSFPWTYCFGIGQKSKIFSLCCAKAFHEDPTINLPNIFL